MQAAINAARSQLPSYLPQNPSYRKANPADAPILILDADLGRGDEAADLRHGRLHPGAEDVADRGRGPGFVGGSSSPAVRVELNPCSWETTASAWRRYARRCREPTPTGPKAPFRTRRSRWAIDDNDQIFKAQDYAPIIAGYNKQTGAPVRIEDLGTVTDSVSNILNAGVAGINPIRGPPAN